MDAVDIAKLVVALAPTVQQLLAQLMNLMASARAVMTDEEWSKMWEGAEQELAAAEASLAAAMKKLENSGG